MFGIKKAVEEMPRPFESGTVSLIAGGALVFSDQVDKDSVILLSVVDARGGQGFLSANKMLGHFEINSTSVTDHSVVGWMLVV